jgi:hypothetical protein
MVLEVEDFSVDIHYEKDIDELKLSTDRELKNSDVLLILIHVMGMVDRASRTDVIDLALAVLEERDIAAETTVN